MGKFFLNPKYYKGLDHGIDHEELVNHTFTNSFTERPSGPVRAAAEGCFTNFTVW